MVPPPNPLPLPLDRKGKKFIYDQNKITRRNGGSRVKPSFPRKVFVMLVMLLVSRHAKDTGNERESKHGDGSFHFCEDYKLVFVPEP